MYIDVQDFKAQGMGEVVTGATVLTVAAASALIDAYGEEVADFTVDKTKDAYNWAESKVKSGVKKLFSGGPSEATLRNRRVRSMIRDQKKLGAETLCKGTPVNAAITAENTNCPEHDMFTRTPLATHFHHNKPGTRGMFYMGTPKNARVREASKQVRRIPTSVFPTNMISPRSMITRAKIAPAIAPPPPPSAEEVTGALKIYKSTAAPQAGSNLTRNLLIGGGVAVAAFVGLGYFLSKKKRKR